MGAEAEVVVVHAAEAGVEAAARGEVAVVAVPGAAEAARPRRRVRRHRPIVQVAAIGQPAIRRPAGIVQVA